jgi:hypothetical protein
MIVGRQIKNRISPQPIQFGRTSDARTASRIGYANLPPEQIRTALLAIRLDRQECRARSHRWERIMRGQKQTIGAVVELARSGGASCSVEQLPVGHLAAAVSFNGRSRKVILSSTIRKKTRSTPSVRWQQISASNSSMMATTRIQTSLSPASTPCHLAHTAFAPM